MRKFQLLLIKPSHYDDDGYVIRWWRAMIPSNSLAAVRAATAAIRPALVHFYEALDQGQKVRFAGMS